MKTHTGTLIDELYALVEKAQQSSGSVPHLRADSSAAKTGDSDSSLDSGSDLTVQTIPAGVLSGRG